MSRLAALTAAAMALPGVHVRAADAPGANAWQFDATHLEYSESGSRMNVRVNQVSAVIPVDDVFQLTVNGIQDVMSGASPQFNAPGPDLVKLAEVKFPLIVGVELVPSET